MDSIKDSIKITEAQETIFNALTNQKTKEKIMGLIRKEMKKIGVLEFSEMPFYLLLDRYTKERMIRERTYGTALYLLIKKGDVIDEENRIIEIKRYIVSSVEVGFSVDLFSLPPFSEQEIEIEIEEMNNLIKEIVEKNPECWLRCSSFLCGNLIPSTVLEKNGGLLRVPRFGKGIKIKLKLLNFSNEGPDEREIILCKKCAEKFFPVKISKSHIEQVIPEIKRERFWGKISGCAISIELE